MANSSLPTKQAGCVAPALGKLVTAYCFGRASEAEGVALENHLPLCDQCRTEVDRLRAAITILETDRSLLRDLTAQQLAGAFGLSGQLPQPFGGHWRWAVTGSAMYGLTLAALLLLEVAYRFDVYGQKATVIAIFVWLGMAGATLLALWWVWRWVVAERAGSLILGAVIMIGTALLLFGGLCQFLPLHPITEASIRAYTAQGAYFKGLFWIVPNALIYLLVPYHFVLCVQRELCTEQHQNMLALVSGEKHSVSPRGAIYPRLWFLLMLLITIGLSIVPGASTLFDQLQPSPYQNLFTLSYFLRWGLQFALGLGCVIWFYRALNEIKRECLIVLRIQPM